MRNFYCPLIIMIAFSPVFSCKKNKLEFNPAASLIVTNAIVGGGNIILNSNVKNVTMPNNAKSFAVIPANYIALYPISDSTKPYYSTSQISNPGGVYSIFLSGQLPNVDAVFIKENAVAYYTDSTIGVRVINLSPNSSSINITLASEVSKNVFFQVIYKQVTDFVKLPLKMKIPAGSVTFQARNSTNNNILATYTLPTSVNSLYPNISTTLSRNRNLTLVIKGLQGTTAAPNAFGVFPVANY